MSTNEDGELRLMQLCTKESWWRVPHLMKLNLMLLIPFFTSYIGGFDGSMLNGIQTVSHWQEGEAQLLMLRLYQITDTSIALRFQSPLGFSPRSPSEHADDWWRYFPASCTLDGR